MFTSVHCGVLVSVSYVCFVVADNEGRILAVQ